MGGDLRVRGSTSQTAAGTFSLRWSMRSSSEGKKLTDNPITASQLEYGPTTLLRDARVRCVGRKHSAGFKREMKRVNMEERTGIVF